MDTPDFCSYSLIRIKLAKTVNEIHVYLIFTYPPSRCGERTSIMAVLLRRRIHEDTGDDRR
ncbi:Uncharacterized protein FKW44_022172, partial [Caligus rogercresseyi]